MAVSSTVFYALHWGVPALIFFVMMLLAARAQKKPLKLLWFLIGALGAMAYYGYFEFGVKLKTLPVYVAQSCEDGDVVYHLPFGEGENVDFDAQSEPENTWVAVQNLTDSALVIRESQYTQENRAVTGGTHLDGYVIPAGETHGLTVASENLNFLKPNPQEILSRNAGAQFTQYAIQCEG